MGTSKATTSGESNIAGCGTRANARFHMNHDVEANWTPPESPDPSTTLHEAAEDARQGRHALALQKYRWFFEHALEYEPAQYGVRLSFALGYWHELAQKYPPAMVELRALRDRATQNAIAGIDVHESFHDASSINRVLDEVAATRELFLALHKLDRTRAEAVYHIAQPILIQFSEFELCGEYLAAESAIEHVIELFHMHRDPLFPGSDDARHRQFAEDHFRNESATVIAILASTKRLDDAHRIAKRIINEWDDPSVREVVSRALLGQFPPHA